MVNSEWVTSKIMSVISGLKNKSDLNHVHDASKITTGTIDAARLPEISASDVKTGVFDVARIPPVALERLVVVADDTARYALTTDTVQVGDTVKVTSSGYMYLVVDEGNLDSDAGYAIYTAGGIDAGQIISGTIDAARLPAAGATLFLERDCSLSLTLPEAGFVVKSFPAISLTTHNVGNISLVAGSIPLMPAYKILDGDIYKCIVPSINTLPNSGVFTLSVVTGSKGDYNYVGSNIVTVTNASIKTYDSSNVLKQTIPVANVTVESSATSSAWSYHTGTYNISMVGVAKIIFSCNLTASRVANGFADNSIGISMAEFTVYGQKVPAV